MPSVVPPRGARVVTPGSNTALEDRQFPKKELERDWAARGPRILIMFRFGKRQIKQLRSQTIPFPDEPVSHAARCFVVVAWPAAIEVDFNLSPRLGENALEQVVLECECARKARNFAKNVGPLPSKIKGNNATER